MGFGFRSCDDERSFRIHERPRQRACATYVVASKLEVFAVVIVGVLTFVNRGEPGAEKSWVLLEESCILSLHPRSASYLKQLRLFAQSLFRVIHACVPQNPHRSPSFTPSPIFLVQPHSLLLRHQSNIAIASPRRSWPPVRSSLTICTPRITSCYSPTFSSSPFLRSSHMLLCSSLKRVSFHQETSRPPLVDSRDVKRMLECPAEEMHMFSDPKNYRTRPRYTRLALPFREIGGIIQVSVLAAFLCRSVPMPQVLTAHTCGKKWHT